MKPRTKLHKHVVSLHQKLPKVTEHQKQYALDKCFPSYGMVMRKTLFCLECGHEWKDPELFNKWRVYEDNYEKLKWDKQRTAKPFECKCAGCDRKILFTRRYNNGDKDGAYYQIITTVEDFQVYRIFDVVKYLKKRKKPHFHFYEIVQHWIGPKGSYTAMAVMGNGGTGYYGPSWSGYELTIKDAGLNDNRYSIGAYKTYPKKKYLPIFKDHGYSGKTYGFCEHIVLSSLVSSPIFETLVKMDKSNLIKAFINYKSDFLKYWPSIKICLRNNYNPKDFSTWRDYLQLLEYFGRDLRSPKYICPEDLSREHDKYVQKKRIIQRKLDAEKARQNMINDQSAYLTEKSKYFDLLFENGNIVITVMQSVQQVMEESDLLVHCAFTNGYYNKKQSLLLSARVDGVITETIEVSLNNKQIFQARGYKNRPSNYNKEIVALVQANMHLIAECMKPKRQPKPKTQKNEKAA